MNPVRQAELNNESMSALTPISNRSQPATVDPSPIRVTTRTPSSPLTGAPDRRRAPVTRKHASRVLNPDTNIPEVTFRMSHDTPGRGNSASPRPSSHGHRMSSPLLHTGSSPRWDTSYTNGRWHGCPDLGYSDVDSPQVQAREHPTLRHLCPEARITQRASVARLASSSLRLF